MTHERIYRVLVQITLPPSFRRESEQELAEVFRDALAATRAGRASIARLWARMAADLAATAASEWTRVAGDTGREVGKMTKNPLREVRLAARTLRRDPLHAVLATLTLALGLGAVVTVFSVVRGVLLRPLPYEQPDRLVRLYETGPQTRYWPSYPNLSDWREATRTLSALVPFSYPDVQPVAVPGGARRLGVAGAGRGFLRMLGVSPGVGRAIADDENRPGGPPVAMISHGLWSGALGSAPLSDLRLGIGDEVFDVVGVVPPGFRVIDDADVWVPLERHPVELGDRGSHGYHVVARIEEGRTLEEVRSEMSGIAARLVAVHGEDVPPGIQVVPLQDSLTAGVREPLLLLLAAAGLLFAVACLNLASTVLARGIGRGRELAVRLAMGAGRGDLIRHLVTETVVVALPGALLGIGVAVAVVAYLVRTGVGIVPRIQELEVDGGALLVAAGLALLASVLAGGGAALALSRRHVGDRLRGAGGSSGRPEHRRLWDGFLVAQTALTVVLLASTALLLRSMRAVLDVELGYDAHGVLVADVSLPESRYADGEAMVGYYERALVRLSAEPSFEEVGVANVLPDVTQSMISQARPSSDSEEWAWTAYRLVDDGFFRTLRIPADAELPPPSPTEEAPVAGLLSRSLVDRFWTDSEAVGSSFRFFGSDIRVEGTVADVREWWQEMGLIGVVYLDYRADPEGVRAMRFVARRSAGTDMDEAAGRLRAALLEVDPEVPATIDDLDGRLGASVARRRLSLDIVTACALLAMLLAGVAVYGAVSYAVARRTREIGIRIALGARVTEVRSHLLRGGLVPVVIGLLIGVAGALAAAPLLRAHLFGVEPVDPWSMATAPLVLLVVAAAASYLPTGRAGRVDPIQALRSER